MVTGLAALGAKAQGRALASRVGHWMPKAAAAPRILEARAMECLTQGLDVVIYASGESTARAPLERATTAPGEPMRTTREPPRVHSAQR